MLLNCTYPRVLAAYREFSPLSSAGFSGAAYGGGLLGRRERGRETQTARYFRPAADGFADLRNRRAVAKATR